MSISTKIKTLLASKNKKQITLANEMGIKYQSLQNKMQRNSFTSRDLIKIAELTGTSLAFVDEDDLSVIAFDIDDLAE